VLIVRTSVRQRSKHSIDQRKVVSTLAVSGRDSGDAAHR